jgi:hypothetical protein
MRSPLFLLALVRELTMRSRVDTTANSVRKASKKDKQEAYSQLSLFLLQQYKKKVAKSRHIADTCGRK